MHNPTRSRYARITQILATSVLVSTLCVHAGFADDPNVGGPVVAARGNGYPTPATQHPV